MENRYLHTYYCHNNMEPMIRHDTIKYTELFSKSLIRKLFFDFNIVIQTKLFETNCIRAGVRLCDLSV